MSANCIIYLKYAYSILFDKNYNYLIYKQLEINNNLYLH